MHRRLIGHDNCLACLCLFKAVSVDGRRDVDLRDPEHADGDRFPRDREMDY